MSLYSEAMEMSAYVLSLSDGIFLFDVCGICWLYVEPFASRGISNTLCIIAKIVFAWENTCETWVRWWNAHGTVHGFIIARSLCVCVWPHERRAAHKFIADSFHCDRLSALKRNSLHSSPVNGGMSVFWMSSDWE